MVSVCLISPSPPRIFMSRSMKIQTTLLLLLQRGRNFRARINIWSDSESSVKYKFCYLLVHAVAVC